MADPPSAIFACNDMMAIGVLSAAAELGLEVPRDLSVIGFDNIGLAQFTSPALTTITQPKYEVGAVAFTMLMERMRDSQMPPRRRVFGLDLIIRGSTGAAPRPLGVSVPAPQAAAIRGSHSAAS